MQKIKNTIEPKPTTIRECRNHLGRCCFSSGISGKQLSGAEQREQHPHKQDASSSTWLVCSSKIRIGNTSHEALLDTGSSISSISEHLVLALKLHTILSPPISVLFGDNRQTYYVLPRQLFPITLGCDWFIKTGTELHFDSRQLILPVAQPLPLFLTHSNFTQINTHVALVDSHTRVSDIRCLLTDFPAFFTTPSHTSQVNYPTQHSIDTGDAMPFRMASQCRSPLE